VLVIRIAYARSFPELFQACHFFHTHRPGSSQAARDPESVTAQSIAEVRGVTAAPAPAPSASPATGTSEAAGGTRTIIVPTTPITVPIEGASSPATEAGAGQQSGASRTQS